VTERELSKIKYAGLMTVSQSGTGKDLIDGVINATKLGVSCINVVNVEDSPITRIIQEIQAQDTDSYTQAKRGLTAQNSYSPQNSVSSLMIK